GSRLSELGPTDLDHGILLAVPGFLIVWQATGHGPGRNKHGRQVAEGKRSNHQSRNYLVAHAKKGCGIKHVVRQTDGRGHRYHVAREQGQFHAWLALGGTGAHGRNAAGPRGGFCRLLRCLLDEARKGLEWLVRREHVVICGDDAQVWHAIARKRCLFGGGTGGKAVGKVAAGKDGAARRLACRFGDAGEIGFAAGLGALADTVRDDLDVASGCHDTFLATGTKTPPIVRQGTPKGPRKAR